MAHPHQEVVDGEMLLAFAKKAYSETVIDVELETMQ